MNKLTVHTPVPYDIIIGKGLLHDVGTLLKQVQAPCRVLVAADSNTAPLYMQTVQHALTGAGFCCTSFVFPAGEPSKNWNTLGALLQQCLHDGLTRGDLLVTLGGGVVGDLTGFAAAVYQRGISYIQLPTTLLAAVDSSVGGKTAVDLPDGKNMAGCFWQPRAVFCDCDTFSTLPAPVFADGMAEVLKYGAVFDRQFFDDLCTCSLHKELENIILRCCTLKARVVQEDERDTGVRALLNFGHTLGHGIEKVSGYTVSHGSAVAVGMVMISRAGQAAGLCEPDTVQALEDALRRFSLPVKTALPLQPIIESAHSDKKRSADSLTVVLPRPLGHGVLQRFTIEEFDRFALHAQ